MVAVIYSDDYLQHQVPYGHPERPARLTAIVQALQTIPWRNQIRWLSPNPHRPVEQYLGWVHTRDYLERLSAICAQGGGYLDGDTPVSPAVILSGELPLILPLAQSPKNRTKR